MISGRVNHLAIFLLIIVHQAVGFVWYTPNVFGDKWLAFIGKTPEEIDPSNPFPYIISVLSSIVLCYTMAIFFRVFAVENILKGISIAFVLWFSFLFLNTATHSAFAGYPSGLVFINTGSLLVQFILTGAVLGAWRRMVKR